MLKKLASLLFEEEEEVIEEEIEKKEVPIKKERSLITSMNPKPIEEVTIIKEAFVEVEHEAVEDIIKPVKPEFGIAFSEPVPLKEKPKLVKEKAIYEFNPVISPMFGISESKKSQVIKQTVNPPQSLKKSRINTVISPIYGDVENHKQVNTLPISKPVQTVFKHDPYIEDVHELPKFKAENYSLDDLLSPIKPQDDIPMVHESIKEEDDELAHQFSLFDEIK